MIDFIAIGGWLIAFIGYGLTLLFMMAGMHALWTAMFKSLYAGSDGHARFKAKMNEFAACAGTALFMCILTIFLLWVTGNGR